MECINTQLLAIYSRSMASPHVAGVAALFWSVDLGQSKAFVEGLIRNGGNQDVVDISLCTPTACAITTRRLVYVGSYTAPLA